MLNIIPLRVIAVLVKSNILLLLEIYYRLEDTFAIAFIAILKYFVTLLFNRRGQLESVIDQANNTVDSFMGSACGKSKFGNIIIIFPIMMSIEIFFVELKEDDRLIHVKYIIVY